MRKRRLFIIPVMTLVMVLTGCGQDNEANAARIRQESTNKEMAYGMEAKAPKTDDAVNAARETEAAVKDSAETEAAAKDSAETEAATEAAVGKDAAVADTPQGSAVLTEEEAKVIALADADIKEADVTGMRVKRERDDGRNVYDVEFYVQGREYDYEIDINTGDIMNLDYEIDDDFAHSLSADSADMISREKAMEIVLAKVNGAAEENVYIELEEDDGRWQYEGEIYYNQREYEFELNALTGKILEWSEDDIDD